MNKHIVAAAACSLLTSAPSSAQEQILIYMSEKCGPASGKTPSQMTDDERKFCEKGAKLLNNALGWNPGFAIAPAALRSMHGIKKIVDLRTAPACNGQNIDLSNNLRNTVNIPEGANASVCTPDIPASVKVSQLRCGGGYTSFVNAEGCRANGDDKDCSWTVTIRLNEIYTGNGRKYCWWVYNQASGPRDYTISAE